MTLPSIPAVDEQPADVRSLSSAWGTARNPTSMAAEAGVDQDPELLRFC
jgi:hypothetical protein